MTTTSGHDFAVQLSSALCNRVLRAAYLDGRIPHTVDRSFDIAGTAGTFSAEIGAPTVDFDVAAQALTNPIRVRFPIRPTAVIHTPRPEAFTIETAVTVVAEVVNQQLTVGTGASQQDLQYVDVSFAAVPDAQFEVTLPPGAYKPYEPLVRILAIAAIKQSVVSLALTPAVPTATAGGDVAFAHVELRVHGDASPSTADVLGLYLDRAPGIAPQHTVVQPFVPIDRDYAVAISHAMVDDRIHHAVRAKFGGDLPQPMPHDPSLILRSLALELRDGHLDVSGCVTKEIDCWPDADIEFAGHVHLGMSPAGQLTAWATDVSVDLPWWADFLGAIVPIFGWIVLYAVHEIAENLVAATISGQASGLLADLAIFAQGLPEATTGAMAGKTQLRGKNRSVAVHADALVLSGDIVLLRAKDAGSTFIGNSDSLEVHALGCAWAAEIAEDHRVCFTGIAEALWSGYNGCWYCLNWYDTDQFAEPSS